MDELYVLNVQQRLSPEQAEILKQQTLTALGRDDANVVVLDSGVTLQRLEINR